MFPTTKIIEFEDGTSILCMDLTYGFILNIRDNVIEDSKENVIVNGTELDLEDVLKLRTHKIEKLYATIMQLTYPHLYNEDGTLKDLSEDDADDGKKKV